MMAQRSSGSVVKAGTPNDHGADENERNNKGVDERGLIIIPVSVALT